MTAPAALSWVVREPPLAAAAVTATGTAARLLAEETVRRLDTGASGLRAAGAGRRLLVLGPADELPWCDGARYLGWDAGVLMPTGRRPSLPADLVAAAARRHLRGAPLVAVLPDGLLGAPVPHRGVDAQALQPWR
ncbi:hypothetical protein Cch01nite_00070 [Cellulomonas chitinilytica]|uniref:MoxR-vWA-beta-propeller ternary system domain-containing protein n=1 Tax=Cellulomonas chitinilytica TaxID=398759 RepID=A0A919TY33_9CELL|nr:hypothetical protein [Cellulomonas chitinilytica]GIG19283.1 hypothetical protein Cch01nite_00070 [Cellulomonas chitinilytica]